MWWLFEQLRHEGTIYEYAYSRENKSLDGLIKYDKLTRVIQMVNPCQSDLDSQWSQKYSAEKFRRVIAEKFPLQWMVACG